MIDISTLKFYDNAASQWTEGVADILMEEPTLVPLSVTANGTYVPSIGTDGYSSVQVNVPNPSTGKINIYTTDEVDVRTYAAAQVVDSNLVGSNIKKDVSILGVVGTYEGTAPLWYYDYSVAYNLGIVCAGSSSISFQSTNHYTSSTYYPYHVKFNVTTSNIGESVLGYAVFTQTPSSTQYCSAGPVLSTEGNSINLTKFRNNPRKGNDSGSNKFIQKYSSASISYGANFDRTVKVGVVDYDAKLLDVDTYPNILTKLNNNQYPLSRGVGFVAVDMVTASSSANTLTTITFN